MNQKIVDYLQQNKENYSKESLVEQLKSAGYETAEINEGVDFIYSSSIDAKTSGKNKNNIIIVGTIALLFVIGVGGIIFYMHKVDDEDSLESDNYYERQGVTVSKSGLITNYEIEGDRAEIGQKLSELAEEEANIKFNFDGMDFIVDEEAPNHLVMKSDAIMYMPTSQTARVGEESGFLITSSESSNYEQASDICNRIKDSIKQSAEQDIEIIDMKFNEKDVCGVYSYEKGEHGEINSWIKISTADNMKYHYIVNSYGASLPLNAVKAITRDLESFEY